MAGTRNMDMDAASIKPLLPIQLQMADQIQSQSPDGRTPRSQNLGDQTLQHQNLGGQSQSLGR